MIEDKNKMRGRQDNLYMKEWAWDFLNELVKESQDYPKPGKGRIVEDMLIKEKARREKRQQKAAEQKPAEPAA